MKPAAPSARSGSGSATSSRSSPRARARSTTPSARHPASASGQHRQSEEGDQQARAEREHRDGDDEADDADRQVQQHVAELAPGARLERARAAPAGSRCSRRLRPEPVCQVTPSSVPRPLAYRLRRASSLVVRGAHAHGADRRPVPGDTPPPRCGGRSAAVPAGEPRRRSVRTTSGPRATSAHGGTGGPCPVAPASPVRRRSARSRQGSSAVTVVGPPAGESTTNSPSTESSRSASPASPVPPDTSRAAPAVVADLDHAAGRPPATPRPTPRRAPLCLLTFCSSSETVK